MPHPSLPSSRPKTYLSPPAPVDTHESESSEPVSGQTPEGVSVRQSQGIITKPKEEHSESLNKSIHDRSASKTELAGTPIGENPGHTIGRSVLKQFEYLMAEHPSDKDLKSIHFTTKGFIAHSYDSQALLAQGLVQQGLARYINNPNRKFLEVEYLFPPDLIDRLHAAETQLKAHFKAQNEKSLEARSVNATPPTSVVRQKQKKGLFRLSLRNRTLRNTKPHLPFRTRWAIRFRIKPSQADVNEIANRFPLPLGGFTGPPFKSSLDLKLDVAELKFCRILEQVGLLNLKLKEDGSYRITIQRPYDLLSQLEVAEILANYLPELAMAIPVFNWDQALVYLPRDKKDQLMRELLASSKHGYRLPVIDQDMLSKLRRLFSISDH